MSALANRLDKLESILAVGGGDWDDDALRTECCRVAREHGVDEDELYSESVKILTFAMTRGLALDSWALVEAWCRETGEDINRFAFTTADLRRQSMEER